MADLTLVTVQDEIQWTKNLEHLGNPHFLQSWQWGEHKSAYGWRVSRYVVELEGECIGAFQLMVRSVGKGIIKFNIGYVPRGPLLVSIEHIENVMVMVQKAASLKGCLYIKVDPDVDNTSTNAKNWQKYLDTNGWAYSLNQIQPRGTAVTDLLQDDKNGEDTLLRSMDKTWRYNIKHAKKRGITVEAVNPEKFSQFYRLYQETSSRQGFDIRPEQYYKEVAKIFENGSNSVSRLFLARHPDEQDPLVAALGIGYGKRHWYFYGASTNKRRADMPAYAVQWTAMRWSRLQGAESYDWWGAPDDPSDKKSSLYTVWHFKKGFGPKHVLAVGAWDKPLKQKFLFALFTRALYLQKKLKKIF